MARVLVVDDEPGVSFTLSEFLKDDKHEVRTAADATEALLLLEEHPFDIVVSDIILPRISGMELLARTREDFPGIEVILITGEPTVASATEAMRAGAVDYLAKPVSGNTIRKAVANAVGVKELRDENRRLQEEIRRHRDHLQDLVDERTRQIVEYSRRLHRIADRTRHFATVSETRELAEEILKLLAEDTCADGGSIYLREPERLVLIHALDPGHQAESLGLPLPSDSIIGRVIDQGAPLMVRDLGRDLSLRPSGWDGYIDGSLLALPLQNASGTIEGVALLHNRREPPFSDRDMELGRIIAGHGMAALKSARLTYSLAESEFRHRALVENAPLGIVSIDRNGRVLDLNPALLKILGSPSADATRQVNLLSFAPLVEAGFARQFQRCIDTGETFSYEAPYRSKWGKEARLRVIGAPIHSLNGTIIGVEAIVEDVSTAQ